MSFLFFFSIFLSRKNKRGKKRKYKEGKREALTERVAWENWQILLNGEDMQTQTVE